MRATHSFVIVTKNTYYSHSGIQINTVHGISEGNIYLFHQQNVKTMNGHCKIMFQTLQHQQQITNVSNTNFWP